MSQPTQTMPNYVKFVFGGVSGMTATLFVQPLDLVKNRMQLSGTDGKKEYKTSFHAFRGILQKEGFFGIYSGLSAGLLRQATYTTTRLGVYTYLYSKMTGSDGKPPNFFMKAGLGMVAGACGAFVGTPAEVALIRMTADGRLPVDQRRNYSNVFNALIRIAREEGFLVLWRGAIPTMGRAMVVNAAQLASYSQAKQALLSTGYFSENILLHFSSSMISGLVTTAASMPVDIAKTRIQNMKMINGKPEYSGAIDVLTKVVRNEGFFALWKGFTPYYGRLGPHTVLTFIFLEQLNKSYIDSALFCPNILSCDAKAKDLTNHMVTSRQQLDRCEENKETWLSLERQNNIFATKVKTFASVAETLKHVESQTGDHHVLVTGSLHLIGTVLSALDPELATFSGQHGR